MAPERRIWVDGELLPWEAATVHVLSQSIQRGSLIFDVMPVRGSPEGPRILGLAEHVERFLGSARLNGMELRWDREALLAGIGVVARANPGTELVKLSGYYSGVSIDVLPLDERASVAIAAFARADLEDGLPRSARAARLQIAEAPKMPPELLSPQLKIAASYTHAAIAKRRARAQGFDDVLFLDAEGHLAESSTHSFFVVIDGELYTAPLDTVLAGITRQALLELAEDDGIKVREQRLPLAALERASEAFLAGTSVGAWPIERIDDRSLPGPVPGPVTERISVRLERMMAGDDPVFSARWMQLA